MKKMLTVGALALFAMTSFAQSASTPTAMTYGEASPAPQPMSTMSRADARAALEAARDGGTLVYSGEVSPAPQPTRHSALTRSEVEAQYKALVARVGQHEVFPGEASLTPLQALALRHAQPLR